MGITGDNNYYEDFIIGDTYIHPRGRTVTEMDNVLVTHMTMNTAQGHFNEDLKKRTRRQLRAANDGGFTISLVIGLTAEDWRECWRILFTIDQTTYADTTYALCVSECWERGLEEHPAAVRYFKGRIRKSLF
jgi:hypothetical protein